ncbi:MAG: LuxR C-terminal-related transcriptional regulator [Prevotellaceae bacterium]|jgi:DNA-binding NarL/FixJ family response regulator|nr:LuxR C-terminal-related transcriptional regulator [Prevotellaceae bacterium]
MTNNYRLNIKIAVAENSTVISRGICAILKHIYHHIEIFTVDDLEKLKLILNRQKPDILIINPNLAGVFGFSYFKKNIFGGQTKLIALQTSLCDGNSTKEYDETLSIYDNEETVNKKILSLLNEPEKDKPQDMLSEREKDVILGVVKGLTNKQIADKLCLSVHTVITHRRNISAKLQIHSAAGLVIYALSNKLVEVGR